MARKRKRPVSTNERPHFTDIYLNQLPLAQLGKRAVYWDGAQQGFGIRIGDSGVKTFVAQKRLDGRPILVTLLRHNGHNLRAAQQAYDKAVDKIAKGIHPTHEKRRNVETTLSHAVADYIE